MEHFETQIKLFQEKYNVSEEALDEVRKLCMAHAINCSMNMALLEQSSAWLVKKLVDCLEAEQAKLNNQA